MKNNKETKAAKNEAAAVEENAIQQAPAVEEPAAEVSRTRMIPQFIKNILQGYPTEEYLYVDSKGGVFDPSTPEAIRKDAVLYKNPYFKNF